MSDNQGLNFAYAEQMKHHPQGHAIYEPISTNLLKPGACGYFDDFGNWNTIVQLDDEQSLLKHGFNRLSEPLEEADHRMNISWGPKCSVGVKGSKFDIPIGVSAEAYGIPVSAKAIFQYSTATDFGAILLTAAPLIKKSYLYESPFRQWVKENAKQINQIRGDEVEKHGLWIVLSTYSTTNCSINAWRQVSKEVLVGFKARVLGEEFGPQGSWYEDQRDTGWNHYHADGNDRVVVFVGALKFRTRRTPWAHAQLKEATRPRRPVFRADGNPNEPIYVQLDEEDGLEIECEMIGQPGVDRDECIGDVDTC